MTGRNTFEDVERLATQLERVRALMEDGEWRTVPEIAKAVKGSHTGCSARLRQIRNDEGRTVPSRPRKGAPRGTWEYRLVPKGEPTLFAL